MKENAASLVGERFERLVVVSVVPKFTGQRGTHLNCKCDCGNKVVAILSKVTSGRKKSCGCMLKDWREQFGRPRHGHAAGKRTSIYRTWKAMLNRCYLKSCSQYKNYGGRGIEVFQPWRDSFERFLDDVGDRPKSDLSLDRIDNDGNYEPGNVRWATVFEQCRNRSNNVRVSIGETTAVQAQVGQMIGVSQRRASEVILRARRKGCPEVTINGTKIHILTPL